MTAAIGELYADGAGTVLEDALERLRLRMREAAPSLSVRTWTWMCALAGSDRPASYFRHPLGFPIVLLPWWLEGTIRGTPDRAFQTDIACSTVAGYYTIRMIDDLMDGDQAAPPEVLPAAMALHTVFQLTYQRLFPAGHQFWDDFAIAWLGSAEAASTDATLREIDRARFVAVAARKVAAAMIPLAAVAYHYGRADLLSPWSRLVDALGRWHQMLNDVLGWSGDLARGRSTYFLSEAARREVPSGAVAEWVIEDGITWARAELDTWMDDLRHAARAIDCPPLAVYLQARKDHASEGFDRLAPSLGALARLASSLRPQAR